MRIEIRRASAAIAAACLLASLSFASAHACLPSDLQHRLDQIRSNFGPIKIISTHRKGATIAGTGKPSYHRWCRAVDFVPPTGKYGAVYAWLNANHHGGVGTYSSGHIHIDNGPHVRFSRGWSGGGTQTARASRSRSTQTASASGSRKRSSVRDQVAEKNWVLRVVQSN